MIKTFVIQILNILQKFYLGRLGAGSVLKPFGKIWNPKLIFIGKDCFIDSSYLFIVSKKFNSNASISIGNNCTFGKGAFISCANSIEIGDHVTLSRNVFIADNRYGDFPKETPVGKRDPLIYGKVKIESGVLLGINSVIIGDVTIGKNSIVGANCVVTKSIPPYSRISAKSI